MKPKFRRVPVAMMDAIIGLAAVLGRFSGTWADRAEFARTGRYYATESMLVWDEAAGRYDPDATPEFGTDTLARHYARLIAGEAEVDLFANTRCSERGRRGLAPPFGSPRPRRVPPAGVFLER